MIWRLARFLLILAVMAGVLLPKSSAALAALGLMPGEQIVICTGQGLQTLRLLPDGSTQPVDKGDPQDDPLCLLVHALDSVTAPALPPMSGVGRVAEPALASDLWLAARLSVHHLARGPPGPAFA